MQTYHENQLTAFTNPERFFLYDLVPVEKVLNFIYTYGHLSTDKLEEQDNDDYHAEGFISLGVVNAILAPTKVVNKYFKLFEAHIKDEKVTKSVVESMDQWSTGFIGMWDYSIYKPDTKLLIYAFDNENLETNHLVSEEDKENYLYTNMKILPMEWSKVNLNDLVHPKTQEPIYQNKDAFLISALHKLDKKTYAITEEMTKLNQKVNQVVKSESKIKL